MAAAVATTAMRSVLFLVTVAALRGRRCGSGRSRGRGRTRGGRRSGGRTGGRSRGRGRRGGARRRGRRAGGGAGRGGRTRGGREDDLELEGGDVGLAAVAGGGGRVAVAAAGAGGGLLVGLLQQDLGDAVDVPQARHQLGDLGLRVGAAGEADRRGGLFARVRGGVGAAERALERADRDVGRDGAGEVAQRLLPVEARVGQVGDGLDA